MSSSPYAANRRRRLGEVLVDSKVITVEQLNSALRTQAEAPPGIRRKRLGAVVVELGYVQESQLAAALAEALDLPLVDLGATTISPELVRLLPQAVASRSGVLLLQRTDNSLTVACADPTNVVALDDVKLYTGVSDIRVVVAPESQLREYLARAWSLSEGSAEMSTYFDDLQPEPDETAETPLGWAEDAPLVRLVNVVLADAVRAGASDVHVQPEAKEVRIRYRVDGVLRDVMSVPRSAAAGLVSRVKVVAGLDIAERRVPQDGRTRLVVDGAKVDCRISTLPSVHGEKVVVRLQGRAESVPAIQRIGFDNEQLDGVLASLASPQGLILITGPTGSGKTNTLYSAINHIRTPERNIVTVEDPVEIQVPGITQMQLHERAGLTFARGLRSILRQDPDVVLVGEVRDTETAKLALEAALTGHLVLTTLHTNDAPAALTRLVDMGVEPFLVASSLSLVVAQRLVRRPCSACVEPYLPGERVLQLLGLTAADLVADTPRHGRGCPDCSGTGYKGRLGVFEVLVVTAAMRAVLLTTPTESAVAAAARAAGMTTMRGSALTKARRGETTFEEVLRVTSVDEGDRGHCVSCGNPLAEDMVACPWCATPVARCTCTGCARGLDPSWRSCPYCRTPAPQPAARTAVAAAHMPRVLLVDPDPAFRSVVTSALAGTAEVDAVSTAEEALQVVAADDYAGVLVAASLPDADGASVADALRADPGAAALPVLLFTEGEPAASPVALAERVGALLSAATADRPSP